MKKYNWGFIKEERFLFHGSQNGRIFELKPMISLEFIPRVYATEDYRYALVRAGKQLDEIREEYYGTGKPFELAECYPGAFEHQFNCQGYIYCLNPKDFTYNPETTEYTSEKPVIPVKVVRIDNLWQLMRGMNASTDGEWYKFIFSDDEEYWDNVRGGREGFLKRKLEAKQKMLKLRDELQ